MTSSTPSNNKSITEGQVGKILELLGVALRKHGAEFPSQVIQLVLAEEGGAFQADLLTVVRTYVERRANVIVRIAKVNRERTPPEVLAATRRKRYVNDTVVASMPSNGTGTDLRLEFFNPGRYLNDDDLEKEVRDRGYSRVADPYELGAVNEADPLFADDHPNGTHWQDANGKWCFATFHRGCDDGRYVHVDRRDDGWGVSWWFAGVRE